MEDCDTKFDNYYNFSLSQNEALIMESYTMAAVIIRSGFTNYKILDQTFLSTSEGITLMFHHLINEAINEKIAALLESGIMIYWIEKAHKEKSKAGNIESDGPQVLTMDHLFIGFAIWLIALTFTIVVFFTEIICRYFKQRLDATRVIVPFIH